jgi:hypothetical protein
MSMVCVQRRTFYVTYPFIGQPEGEEAEQHIVAEREKNSLDGESTILLFVMILHPEQHNGGFVA